MIASITDRLARRLRTFRHGTHPDPHKDTTSALPIEHMPVVDAYALPLSQHAGAPSRPCVSVGERVQRGQRIANPDGQRSVALHAPVTGTVSAIELRAHPSGGLAPAMVLRTDHYADQSLMRLAPCDPHDHVATLAQIQAAGIVGLGGASYPAHAKLILPEGARVDLVVANGAECEPYLTSDHRVMVEHTEAVVSGLAVVLELLGAREGRIGVEVNKPDAIGALEAACRADSRISVVPLKVKYPEGAKQMMIEAVTGQRVPIGGRSFDAHVTIHNVATIAAVYSAVVEGAPLVDRVVTVTGDAVRRPANVRVPFGTPLSALIEHCGGLAPGTRRIVVGGAMMGQSQAGLDVPVVKATGGILALMTDADAPPEEPCIRCGQCLDACAMFLNPTRLAAAARAGDTETLAEANVGACFECGSCAFICPSHIPLTELIRTGKDLVRKAGK